MAKFYDPAGPLKKANQLKRKVEREYKKFKRLYPKLDERHPLKMAHGAKMGKWLKEAAELERFHKKQRELPFS